MTRLVIHPDESLDLLLDLGRFNGLFLEDFSETALATVLQWGHDPVVIDVLLVHLVRVLGLVLRGRCGRLVVVGGLAFLADEQLADVRSLVEGLPVDSLLRLQDRREIHELGRHFPAVEGHMTPAELKQSCRGSEKGLKITFFFRLTWLFCEFSSGAN